MDRRSSFLSSVLGQDSAQALAKVAERCAPLGSALLPRAVVAWVGSVPQFEGTIPGIENSYVRFTKSALGYSGTINIREQNYEFEGATQEHVASAVIVALGLDTAQIAAGAREIDLARLGKSSDLLVRARAATALLKAQAQGQRHGTPAQPLKPEESGQPAVPTKQQTPPKLPAPKPQDYVPVAPKAKVQFAKIKLPGVKITKSEMVHACGDCGTRFLSAAGTLRGCLCVRDLLKHVEIEDEGDHYTLAFGAELDHDTVSFIVETMGAKRGR